MLLFYSNFFKGGNLENNKHIKWENNIIYFLKLLNVSENSYSIGEYRDNCICIFDDLNGYKVFNVINNNIENVVIVPSMFCLIHEILKRIELLEEKIKKR